MNVDDTFTKGDVDFFDFAEKKWALLGASHSCKIPCVDLGGGEYSLEVVDFCGARRTKDDVVAGGFVVVVVVVVGGRVVVVVLYKIFRSQCLAVRLTVVVVVVVVVEVVVW